MKKYRTIFKKTAFWGGRNSWMACKEHLLHIKSNGYTEDYKRFFFNDIQWIKLVANKFSIFIDILIGLISFIFGIMAIAIAFVSPDEPVLLIIFSLLSGLFLFILIVNRLLGPSARLIIKTHTRRDEIPVNRFRKGLKLLKGLNSYIGAAQGNVPKTEILARLQADEKERNNKLVI